MQNGLEHRQVCLGAAALGAALWALSAGAQESSAPAPTLDDILRQAETAPQYEERVPRPGPQMSTAEASQWRMRNCWQTESDLLELKPVEVHVRVWLDINQRLKASPQVLTRADGGDEDDPYYKAVAEVAVRAAIRCAPYWELSEEAPEFRDFVFNPVLMDER